MSTPLLALSSLTKRYGATTALDGLDLAVAPGEVVGLLGPNGAGKSTTIRLALGLAEPSAGTVRLFGRPPRETAVRARVGYLPGDLALDGRLTGAALLALLGKLSGPPPDARRRAVLCERLSLAADDLARPIRDDSSGTRQKLGLVAAWQHDPDLLVLDEPTNGLDPLVREAVFELMHESALAGRAVLHSSHVLSEVQRTCSSVAILRAGRLVARGDVAALQRDLVRRMVIGFRGAPPLDDLRVAGAELLEHDGSRVVLAVRGALDPLLDVIAAHPVDDLAFPEPDLAEAFAHWYGADDGEPRP